MRALRRLRHPDVVACAVLVVIVLLGFAEVVFGGRTLSAAATVPGVNGPAPFTGQPPLDVDDVYRTDRGASSWQFEPWVEVNNESYARADAPLWNPYQGAGAPHAANMQSAAFDPLLLPVNLHPTPLAWDVALIGAFVIAALATYAFGRVLGLHRVGAVVAGSAFSLSGYFLIFSHNQFARTYVYLPILFLMVELVVRSRRVLPVLGLAVAVAGTLLVGMPEAAAMVLTAAGLYAAARAAGGIRDGWRPLATTVARVGTGLVAGVLLAAPLLLLLAEYLPLAFNSHEAGLHGVAADGLDGLSNWVMPFLKGATWKNAVDGGFTGLRSYVGAGAAALALVALAGGREARGLHAPAIAFVGAAFVVKVYDFKILEWVGRLPAYDVIDFRPFGAPVIGFPLAMLAGIGVHVLMQRKASTRWFLALAGAGAGGLIAVLLMDPNRRALQAVSNVHLLRHVGLAAGSAAVIAGAVLLARRISWVAWTAAGVVVLELLLLAPRDVYPKRADPFTQPAWVAPIVDDMGDHPGARVFGLEAKLFPNTASALGLYDIRALDGLYVNRYLEYVKTFLEPTVFDRFQGGPYSAPEEVFTRFDTPMLDLLGVRYLIASGPRRTTALLDQVLSSITPSAQLAEWAMDIGGDQRIALMEVPGQEVALPAPPPGTERLSFSYGVDGRAFRNPRADGTVMAVVGETAGERTILWQDEYVPGEDPVNPEWREAEVPLEPGAFDRLLLVTSARATPDDDVPGWTDLEYGGPGRASEALRLLTRDDSNQTWVYERPSAYPRAFVVHNVRRVDGIEGARGFFRTSGTTDAGGAIRPETFNPRAEAVVEAAPDDVPVQLGADGACTRASGDRVRLVAYRAQYARVEVETPCAGLLVLSDTYYPGWKAEVDGRAADIHPTDLALRGVFVPAGRSAVEFRYEPKRFGVGLLLAALVLVAFGALALAAMRRRRRSSGPSGGRPAVFFDRDGVLNEGVLEEGSSRPPHDLDELRITEGAGLVLTKLRDAGYLLVVVTNQPDVTRGTVELADVQAINSALEQVLPLDRIVMCVHDNAAGCQCRKPAPGMILDAADDLGIDLARSWLVGDRWVDIAAGNAAGVRTVLLDRPYSWQTTSSGGPPDDLEPDARVESLAEFADLVLGDALTIGG